MKELHDQVDAITKSGVPNRHTFFQLLHFVVGKEPTHQAKMKRCVDELKSRKSSVESILMEMDDTRDRNQLIEESLTDAIDKSETQKRMARRMIRQNEISLERLVDKLKSVEEEMLFFVEMFNQLNVVEAFKNWDDVDVQNEYWNAKLMEEVNYRLMMRMPIDFEVVRTALALPASAPIRKKIVALIGETKVLQG